MKYGVFEHMDNGGQPLWGQYESRLRLIEAYDRGGFHAFHLAEHHATPLGMAPSPAVFLAAVAQRTKRLRFGPLVYILTLQSPLRAYEEICMLDQMSGVGGLSWAWAAAFRRSRWDFMASIPPTGRVSSPKPCA